MRDEAGNACSRLHENTCVRHLLPEGLAWGITIEICLSILFLKKKTFVTIEYIGASLTATTKTFYRNNHN